MKETIGVLLAGGTGSRLYPLTTSVNKHLLPVYSKPLIYYSLSTLMLAQNREVLLVINPKDKTDFKNLLGDGSKFGIKLTYVMQENPKGIADALNNCSKLAKGKNKNLILGDNIFYGHGMSGILEEAVSEAKNSNIATDVAPSIKKSNVPSSPKDIYLLKI